MSGTVSRLWAAKDEFLRTNSWPAYSFAAICVALATLLRLAVHREVTLLFPTYYVAVLVVSLVEGFRASVFAILLSVLAAWWLFLPPTPGFGPLSAVQTVNVIFFVAVSLTIAWIGNANRRLLSSLRKERDYNQLLVSELRHRGQNMLMMVQAIISQTVKRETEKAALLGRIRSLAIPDELRTASDQRFIHLQQIAQRQLQSFPDRVSIQGPPLLLDSMLTKVTVLMLHELVTNAVKYGALSQPGGNVVLTWGVENGIADITWRELGEPVAAPPKREGMGLALIERLARTVGGELSSEFTHHGVVHKITFPLPKDVQLSATLNATNQLQG